MFKVIVYNITPVTDIITLIGMVLTPYVYDTDRPNKIACALCLFVWSILIIQGIIELIIVTREVWI
jgi:hypothetical protein